MLFNIVLIFFFVLTHCQEKGFLIVDSVDQKENISLVWYQIPTASNQMSDKQRITNNIHDYKKNKKKLGFMNIGSITNFIEYGLEDKPPKRYLTKLIQRIEECHPYNNHATSIYNLTHGDSLIEFILEKLEKIFSDETVLALDFDQNIEFYQENSVKKVRLKKHDHATIEIQDSLKQEEKESVPPKTNTLFKIKDKNSAEINTVSYDYFFNDISNSFTQSNIEKNIINRKKDINNEVPIFFTTLNAIKNYIYFTIGYDNNNHLKTRKKLFKICETLSKMSPYNTPKYEFKPEDREIIDLLEILEKIHNKSLKEIELEEYHKQIKNAAKPISPVVKDNELEIPATRNPDTNNKELGSDKLTQTNKDQQIENPLKNQSNSINPLQNSNNSEENKIKKEQKNTTVNNTISMTEETEPSDGNKNPSLKKSSIIKYLFGLTVCATSLICLYKLFNPYILKRIYQPS